jgi:hypothetical protein
MDGRSGSGRTRPERAAFDDVGVLASFGLPAPTPAENTSQLPGWTVSERVIFPGCICEVDPRRYGHEAECPASVREAFDVSDVVVGDVIRYPAILRPEHGGERSERLVVVRIEGEFLRCLSRVNGEKRESSIYPAQLRENGIVVEAHVGDDRG